MVTWTLQQLAIGLAEAGNAALNLTAGQTFNYGKRKNRVPDVTINNGAKLAVNITGKINYMTPADPTADLPHFEVYTGGGCSLGKTVTVENGGVLQIGDPGSSKTGVFHALRESVVRVKTGGTLRIDNSSSLIIYAGAKIILEPGAIVRLTSSNAKIRIEGKLIVNGDISFSGLGYFEFAQGNQLEYGPNYQTFLLAGAGMNNRFIRIEDEVRVPAGRNIDLRQGAVEVVGTRLLLQAGSGGSFTQVKFYGGTLFAIQGEQSASLLVQNCQFEDFSFPVHLTGGTGTALLRSTVLENYSAIGVYSENRPGLQLDLCTLNSPYASDGIYSKNTVVIIQRSTTITGTQSGTYSNNGPSPNNDPLVLTPPTTGVRLEGGWLYWMDGGEINGTDVGLANLAGYPVNLYMNHFATIRDCFVGVSMRGNATTGLVAMNCARLINNYFGIQGRDVTLLIDPALLNGQSTQKPNSNVFIRQAGFGPNSGSEYLHVCYGAKTPPNPIQATQNYWGSTDGATVSTDPTPADHKFLCYNPAATGGCGASSSGCTVIGLNTSLSVGRQPISCPQPGALCEDPDGSCIEQCALVVVGGESPTVRGQFLAAMDRLHNEDFTGAKAGFQPPADLWGPGSLTFSTVCRTYIDAARSLTDNNGFSGSEGGEERNIPNVDDNIVQIVPNPTSGEVLVLLPGAELYSMQVWSLEGILLLSENITGPTYHFNGSEWPDGLYFINFTTRNGMLNEVHKLVIQH